MDASKLHARPLDRTEWAALRDVRLRALKGEPGVFGASHDAWVNRGLEDWQALIAGPGHQVFGLFDREQLVGITGVVTSKTDPTGATALLVMSYLLPQYRGQGLSRLLYDVRLRWIRSRFFKRVVVSHRASNAASMRANQRHGFQLIRREMRRWPDGTEEDEVFYEMCLPSKSPA